MAAKQKSRDVAIDRYVIATLMRDLVGHDRRPSAFLAYLALAARDDGDAGAMSYADLAEATGLSRRAAQDAVAHLRRRGLIEARRDGPTGVSCYRTLAPWRRRTQSGARA